MNLNVDLSGRVALVTGSTSGMGRAIAELLARNGAQVVVHGLGAPEELAEVSAALTAASGEAPLVLEHDLAEPGQAADMVEQVLDRYGRLDILVNNAGIQHVAVIDEFPDDAWERVLAVDLSAAFYATKRAVPGMRARGWGRIINTASTLGHVAEAHKAAYISAKHGLIGLTRAVALDTAEAGITCNAICPGWVLTPLAERQVEAAVARLGQPHEVVVRDHFLLLQPTRRFVTTDEIAASVLFLCSHGAASITGVSLPVDGGQLII